MTRHGPADRRPGGGALPRQPVERARRRAAEAVRRVLRHLRPRQRRRHRPGAARRTSWPPRPASALPYVLARNEQAMVHTAVGYARQKDRLQTWAVHRVRRPRLDQHAHRRRARHHQPAPGAAAALGHLRHPGQRAGAPGARGAVRRRRHGQRRVPPAVALLRPGRPPRAAAVRAARRDAGAHRPGRDRRRDDRAAAGRAGRGVRLAGRALRDAGLARRPPAGRGRRGSRRRRMPSASARRPLIVAGGGVHYSGAEEALRAFATATGIPVGETQAGKGSLPHGHPQAMGAVGVDGHDGRQRAGRARPTSSSASAPAGATSPPRREPPSGRGRPLRQHQHRRLRRRQARGLSVVADAREALTALTAALDGYAVDAGVPRAPGRRCGATGTRRWRRPTTRPPRSPTARRRGCSPRAPCSARSTS